MTRAGGGAGACDTGRVPITRDLERLQRVAGELGAAINEPERGARVRLPVVQRADAAGLMMVMHDALDEAIADRAKAAAADGHHIACAVGCNACCTSPVLVGEAEAVTVAEWLAAPEHAEVRARFTRAYREWKVGAGAATGALRVARAKDEQRAAALEYKRAGVMCAFNHDGLCSIYEARPSRCRRAHALETNAGCGADGTEVRYFEHTRTELTFQGQEPMRAALDRALRPGLELLCAAVHRLLYAELGRNAPCPCGSGDKYKRCCAD